MRQVTEKSLDVGEYPIELSETNVLPLAIAKYKIADGNLSEVQHILDIDDAVRQHLGIQCRKGHMEQPWVRKNQLSDKTVQIFLKYDFNCKKIPNSPLYLGIEKPETFRIVLNGQELSTDNISGWWCDKSLKKIAIDPALLIIGSNDLELKCCYSEAHPGLEYLYLLGNFGVTYEGLQLTMTSPVDNLKIGDWVEQGLPFYSGIATYNIHFNCTRQANEHLFIRLPEYRGTCVKVTVNGKEAGVIAWEPNELDITDWVEDGDNQLQIAVVSSRRNSHGPLFHPEKWPIWTGPAQYHQFSGKFNLVPCGLLTSPMIIVKSSNSN
jgi:hypothetical protein